METVIIGAGAAGLMAACRLLDAGCDVLLLERNDRVGRKVAITGKGRCNVTNDCDFRAFLENVPTNPKFLYGALGSFPPAETMSYFEQTLGLPLKVERGNRVFPVSDKAADVVNAFKEHLRRGSCRIVQAKAERILTAEDGSVCGVLAGGKNYPCKQVLLATGGASYPVTGSDGSGHRIAMALGHTVVELKPSLVPVECYGHVCKALQGLSLKNTALTLYDTEGEKKVFEDFGELLFTHFGLSGPMILSSSAHMKGMKAGKYRIELDLKPALDEKQLDKRLLADFSENINRDFSNSLDKLLPSKLIPVIVSLSGIDPKKKVNGVTKEERAELIRLLKHFRLTVKGFRPIAEAIVTSGGVDVKEVNPKTMESKLVKGLYFAGEILDVDAYTGGFNLQIAFATASLAARAMASES
ncbi:MAG: NAD(P)/FAD-dependent oxidoreductase [Clostridia bacterium]|nr:NAD(P)/FAD-dependent oxidoreductase [Clostridia bacterium]